MVLTSAGGKAKAAVLRGRWSFLRGRNDGASSRNDRAILKMRLVEPSLEDERASVCGVCACVCVCVCVEGLAPIAHSHRGSRQELPW